MTEGLGAQYLERKKAIEAEIQRLQGEAKKGSDFQADLQRQHSEIGRQLQAIQAEFLKQSGKLEAVNESLADMKQEVMEVIPSKKK